MGTSPATRQTVDPTVGQPAPRIPPPRQPQRCPLSRYRPNIPSPIRSCPARPSAMYASTTSNSRSTIPGSPASNHRMRPSVSLYQAYCRHASPNDARSHTTDQTSRHQSRPSRRSAMYASTTSNSRSPSPGSPASKHRRRPSVSLRPVYRRRANPNDPRPHATDQTSRHQSCP